MDNSHIRSLEKRIRALESEQERDHILAGDMLRGILKRLDSLEASHIPASSIPTIRDQEPSSHISADHITSRHAAWWK